MAASFSIRRRLLAIATLSAIVCVTAAFALLQLARTSDEQRIERAKQTALREVERNRQIVGIFPADPSTALDLSDGDEVPIGRRFRGRRRIAAMGQLLRRGRLHADLSPFNPGRALAPELYALARTAAQAVTPAGEPVIVEREEAAGSLVGCAARLPGGGYVWVAVLVPRLSVLEPWRIAVGLLALTALLVVATSLFTVAGINRSARALQLSLERLARDLRSPVDRSEAQELDSVALGVGKLAEALGSALEEQKRLGRELERRERLATLGRVAAGVAHEVRNPLAAIKLRADLAGKTPDTPEAVTEDLAAISAEVARLDRLVSDLLVVAGRRVGPKVPSDVAQLVRKRVELLGPWARERGISLVWNGEGTAAIDADGLARAIDNLLRNAVEASPQNATVTASVQSDGTTLRITVEDHGAGVPENRVQELFEPFFTTKSDGTGLGLALSRSVAAAHGGTLEYQRAAQRTRFTIVLPVTAISPNTLVA